MTPPDALFCAMTDGQANVLVLAAAPFVICAVVIVVGLVMDRRK